MTGILPIALEDATKILQAFLLSGKEYVCLMRLHEDISEDRLKQILEEFTGDIYQKPPLKASVKRVIRKRIIYNIELLEKEGKNALIKVACQSGTYIRKLVYDIGEAIGCGAHMKELRRIRAGPFTEERNLYDLYDLSYAIKEYRENKNEEPLRKVIRPMEEALEYMNKIYIKDSAVDALCHGADLAIPGIVKLSTNIKPNDLVAILTLKNEAVAFAKALMSTKQILDQEHGIAAKTVRVIMPIGTYPALWKKVKN